MKNYGDITCIDGAIVEPVDCIIGGSPCQNLSVAGNKKGLQGSESRLFYEQIRVVEEMRKASGGLKPRFMVWENVVGALSCNGGKDFLCVLNECVRAAVQTQKECINGKSGSIPNVPLPKGGKWPKAGILYDGMGGGWSIAWRIHNAQFWGVAQCRRRVALVVDFGGLSAPKVLFEPKSVQGYNETDIEKEGNAENTERRLGESGKQYINCLCIGNGQMNSGLAKDICQTLNCMHDPMTVVYGICSVNSNSMKSSNPRSGIYEAEISRTLDCFSCGSPARNQGGMAVVEPYCIDMQGGKSHGNFRNDGCVYNIIRSNGYDMHTVCTPVITYKVRRLTPLECTRLQGFPDGWVDIGEWIDSKGKKHIDSDRFKYKALGNSIALPFWEWLCKNIVSELKSEKTYPTMASLFDGIGGFTLCWIRATGKRDSVKWISEIDEFALAVTRYNFGDGNEKHQ